MNLEDKYFYVEIDNKKIKYKIIKIIIPSNGKYKYVVYTDNDTDIYASRFEIKNDNVILKDIKYQYEFDYIDRVLESEV